MVVDVDVVVAFGSTAVVETTSTGSDVEGGAVATVAAGTRIGARAVGGTTGTMLGAAVTVGGTVVASVGGGSEVVGPSAWAPTIAGNPSAPTNTDGSNHRRTCRPNRGEALR